MLTYADVCRAVVDSHSSASPASAVVPRRDNGGFYIYNVYIYIHYICILYIYNVSILYMVIYIYTYYIIYNYNNISIIHIIYNI